MHTAHSELMIFEDLERTKIYKSTVYLYMLYSLYKYLINNEQKRTKSQQQQREKTTEQKIKKIWSRAP